MTTTVVPRGWYVPNNIGVTDWARSPITGGGWVTGISMEGTERLARTDTYMCWRWIDGQWEPIVTDASMPADEWGPLIGGGAYEALIAPADTNIFWFAYGDKVFKSVDYGANWVKKFTGNFRAENYGSTPRMFAQRMAIDPNNSDVVYIGALNNLINSTGGMYYTTDGGENWTKDTNLPENAPTNGYAIAFDKASAVSGGRTQRMFCAVQGSGVYKSTNAGASWTLINGPTAQVGITVSTNGSESVDSTVFSCDGSTISRWNGTSWATTSRAGCQTILVDPLDSDHLIGQKASGQLFQSNDDGVTWGSDHAAAPAGVTKVAPNDPWLVWTAENYMSAGTSAYDPQNPTDIWFPMGIGVWKTSPVWGATSNTTWTSVTDGIVNMVSQCTTQTPGNPVVFGFWDRVMFVMTAEDIANNVKPERHYPNRNQSLMMTWDACMAKDGTIVHVSTWAPNWDDSGVGRYIDDGTSWTTFGTIPTMADKSVIGGNGYGYGAIACDPNNADIIVWAGVQFSGYNPVLGTMPWYSDDGGDTWTVCTFPGITQAGSNAVGFFSLTYYLVRHIVCADDDGNFFIWFTKSGDTDKCGLYRRAAGSTTWVKMSTEPVSTSDPVWYNFHWSEFHVTLKAAPGQVDDIWQSTGHSGQGNDTISTAAKLIRSTNGGSTWSVIPNVAEPYTFGFGAPAPGNTYPSMYMVGWVDQGSGYEYGMWMTDNADDATPVWTNIGTYPNGISDFPSFIAGDADIYGRVYYGGRSTSVQWRQAV